MLSHNRLDLMQELLGKINDAHETASRYELKMIELLEKQTKLQEESIKTNKEFLNSFRNAEYNMGSKQ